MLCGTLGLMLHFLPFFGLCVFCFPFVFGHVVVFVNGGGIYFHWGQQSGNVQNWCVKWEVECGLTFVWMWHKCQSTTHSSTLNWEWDSLDGEVQWLDWGRKQVCLIGVEMEVKINWKQYKKRIWRKVWTTGKGNKRERGKEKGGEKRQKKMQKKVFSTRDSNVVTHHSTNRAHRCLTSEFWWDRVLSPGYDRRQQPFPLSHI